MPLAAFDFLAPIIPALGTAHLSGFDRLTIDARGTGSRLAPRLHTGLFRLRLCCRPSAAESALRKVAPTWKFACYTSGALRHQPPMREEERMALEDAHLDVLIDLYRAKARGHTPKEVNLPEPETTVFHNAYTMCEFRLGRPEARTRIQVPFDGDKTESDILACFRKIRKSVERWNKRGGHQGYLQFVSEYIK